MSAIDHGFSDSLEFRTKTLTARVSPSTMSRIDEFTRGIPYASRADALEFLFMMIDVNFGLHNFARLVYDYHLYRWLDGAGIQKFIGSLPGRDTSAASDTFSGECDTKSI